MSSKDSRSWLLRSGEQLKLLILLGALSLLATSCSKSSEKSEEPAPPPPPPPVEKPAPPTPLSIINAGNPLRFREGSSENTYPRLTPDQLNELRSVMGALGQVRVDRLLISSQSEDSKVYANLSASSRRFLSDVKRNCTIKPYTYTNLGRNNGGTISIPLNQVTNQTAPGTVAPGAPSTPNPGVPTAPATSGPAQPDTSSNPGPARKTIEATIDGYSCPVNYVEVQNTEIDWGGPLPAPGQMQSANGIITETGHSRLLVNKSNYVSEFGLQEAFKNWTAYGVDELTQGQSKKRSHYHYDGGLRIVRQGQPITVKVTWITDEVKMMGADRYQSRDVSSTLKLEMPEFVVFVESYRHFEKNVLREERYFMNGVPVSARELLKFIPAF